jgi:hypothetical protein
MGKMLKVAYAPRFTDLGCRYDYGFYKPLQKLSDDKSIDLKVFLPYRFFGQKKISDRRFIPDAIYYNCGYPGDGNNPLGAIKTINGSGSFLNNALDNFKPDIVVSYYNISAMKHKCKKVWICHEYWPQSMAECIGKDKGELIDMAYNLTNKIMMSFDFSLSPSKLACKYLKEHETKVKLIDIFLDIGDPTINYKQKKVVMLNATADGWFRYKLIMESVQPLLDKIKTIPDIDFFRTGGTFDAGPISCGIVPCYYRSSEPSKVYSHLACGIPSLALNYEQMDEEVGVYPYSVENVIRCVDEDWRSKNSELIFNSFKVKHGIDRLSKNWLDFTEEIMS